MTTPTLPADEAGIDRAARLLAAGEIVAIPTETVYGLAGAARDPQAVARIYAAKGRPGFNPLIVHVAGIAEAERIGVLDGDARRLAQVFWPGALTLVVPLREDAGIASLVTAGLATVGLRVPAHPVAQAVLRALGQPLAAPSANASGRISPTTAAHVLDANGGLDGRIAAVVDGGASPVGLESTIVGWRGGRATLLRPGGVPAEAIEALIGPLAPGHDLDAPDAPGQLGSHYAPDAPLRLNADGPREGETFVGFGPASDETGAGALTLSATGDPVEAAARLFDVLRQADRLGRPIAVAPIPDAGLGAAINDRLRRAAAPR